MTRYTTPTLPLSVDADLSNNRVFVTISQGSSAVTKEITDFTVTDNVTDINMPLTQAETALFSAVSGAQVQVNWINEAGDRGATDIQMVKLFDNLLQEVISYADPESNSDYDDDEDPDLDYYYPEDGEDDGEG